jgi:hypothetical protein
LAAKITVGYFLEDIGQERFLVALVVPPYKCERGYYKQILRRAVQQTGIAAQLGGLEYGPDIARALDLYAAGKADTSFKHFVDELRAVMDQLRPYLIFKTLAEPW